MRLLFRRLAVRDLADIEQTISADSERRARQFLLRIRRRCELLVTAPYQGRARPDLGDGLRSVAFRPYLVVYRVDDDAFVVVRVVHSSRDLMTLFKRPLN